MADSGKTCSAPRPGGRALLVAIGGLVLLAAAAAAGFALLPRGADPAPIPPEAGAAGPPPGASAPRAPDVWFGRSIPPPALSPRDRREIAARLAAGLAGRQPRDPSGLLGEDGRPRIALLSVRAPGAGVVIGRGDGEGLRVALDRALADVRGRLPAGPGPRAVRLDLVGDVRVVARAPPRAKLDFREGIDGIALPRETGAALPPGLVAARAVVGRDGRLDPGRLRDCVLEAVPGSAPAWDRMAEEDRVTLFLFATEAFLLDGDDLLPLHRGNRMIEDPGPADLLEAAVAGGRYLSRKVDRTGRFVYSYDARAGAPSAGYNILRHAGTAYSLLEVHRATGDREFLAAAERALDWLAGGVRDLDFAGGRHRVVEEGGEVKLGGNALACVALAEHIGVTGDRSRLDLLVDLGRFLLAAQSASGEFGVHKLSWPGGKRQDFVSAYYPGEALLALARIHALTGEEVWIEAAARGARWLIDVRDGGKPVSRLDHDHWLLYALDGIHRARPEPRFLDHARRIVSAILAAQHLDPAEPDWRGGFYRPPRSTPTATRSEGLAAAWRLERDFGDAGRAARIRSALRAGTEFQLRTQIRPESALYLPDPAGAIGGFRESLTGWEVRIDYVQHNLSALLAYREILERSR